MRPIYFKKQQHYKYKLASKYAIEVSIFGYELDLPFIQLKNGLLIIKRGYAWDGPSGPTIDTKNFIRGSLVHDALYQLIRSGNLPLSYREDADILLRRHCVEDGMWSVRAWWIYQGVKYFGAKYARPNSIAKILSSSK